MDPGSNAPLYLEKKLTRSQFEDIIRPLLDRIKGPVEQALKDAKVTKDEIDEVILVGGSTRVPAVKKIVKDVLSKEPNQSVNPDEVVALGAAVQAGVLNRRCGRYRAAGRHAAEPGCRNQGWRVYQAHRAQHDRARAQVRNLHHRGKQPDRRRGTRFAGRALDGKRQQDLWADSNWTVFRR